MVFSKIATALTVLFGTVQAFPAVTTPETAGDLVRVETIGNRTLHVYALPEVPRERWLASESQGAMMCGSNRVECDRNNNRAPADLCWNLLYMFRDTRHVLMDDDPRSFCHWGNGIACCVSWTFRNGRIERGSLIPAIEKTAGECTYNMWVSGKTFDTNLEGQCVNQCLSARPEGC